MRISDFRFRVWAVAICAVILIGGCGGKSGGAAAFDGERAYKLLKAQCAIGPRYSGVPGHAAEVRFIESQLKGLADEVSSPVFTLPVRGRKLEFQNVYAVFNPQAKKFILLSAHWDSRPTADEEVDPVKRRKPIPGADDGASGVAVLLELARMFKSDKPEVGVVMVFFDGEDYGPGETDMYIGARQFAANWRKIVRPGGREIGYEYGILLDMVGDKDLNIPKERLSVEHAPAVVDKVWSAARKLGYSSVFTSDVKYGIDDDHIPLQRAGIKCIDIIDFDYGPWHTLDDTPDKCSAKSLATVGKVVARVVYDEGR